MMRSLAYRVLDADFHPEAPWNRTRPASARVVRALGALAVLGAAAGLFVQPAGMTVPALDAFVRANWLGDEERNIVFGVVLAGALTAAGIGGTYLLSARAAGLARIEWLTTALRPLVPLALVPTLLMYE